MKKVYFVSTWRELLFDDGTDYSPYFSSYKKAKDFIMSQSATKGLKMKTFSGESTHDKVCFFRQGVDDSYFYKAELIYDICECDVL